MKIVGKDIYNLAEELYPICRSITGKGVRETLKIINDHISIATNLSLNIIEVPTGTKVFDWTVPKEWEINEAYIENERGEKLIDFKENNLHVLGYSLPMDEWMPLKQLLEYVYTQKGQDDWIPYVTSYYKERSGFCMSETQKKSLPEGNYHAYIDSRLFDGSLTYGEIILEGKSKKEIFFSTYICHPSMANNECSGPALVTELIKYVHQLDNRKYTYRFIFIPETIGSITYLSRNLDVLKENMIAGFNISCVGDDRAYSMVETRKGRSLADRVLKNILKDRNGKIYSYLKRASDEKQYNAPGVDLPVVCFSRTKFHEYPEYHTSADNMELINPSGFQGAYEAMTEVIDALEFNDFYTINVLCEPQLGRRGLYPTLSQKGSYDDIRAMRDFIAYADGETDLIEISDIIQAPIKELIPIIKLLRANNLIQVKDD